MDGCLYVGEVMHKRLRPKQHRFVYRVFTWLFDLDRLDGLARRLCLFSLERRNIFSFYNKDHGPRDGSPLRPWVEGQLAHAGFETVPARICLLAMPRFLGYVFNPLSIYYCYDGQDRLFAVVHEVKNTFGGQHCYVLPVAAETASPAADIHQACDKDFYVSPFIEAAATYHFRLNRPSDRLRVVIREEVDRELLLIATLMGKRQPLTDSALIRQIFRHPFVTQKVIASIHIQALKLWLKGIRLQPREATRRPAAALSTDQKGSPT